MNEREVDVVDLREAPVIIELDALGMHDSVLTALAQRYEREGSVTHQLSVVDRPDGETRVFDLTIDGRKVLLDVETDDTVLGLDAHRYEGWLAAGYEVILAAPEDKVEKLTRRLKGTVSQIEGWRMEGPQVIFTEPVKPKAPARSRR